MYSFFSSLLFFFLLFLGFDFLGDLEPLRYGHVTAFDDRDEATEWGPHL